MTTVVSPCGSSTATRPASVCGPSSEARSTSSGRMPKVRAAFAAYCLQPGPLLGRERQQGVADLQGRTVRVVGRRRRQHVDRQVADELGDEAVDWPVEEVEEAAVLLQAAVVHHRDAVGDRRRLLLIVRDVDGGGVETLVQAAHLGPELHPEISLEVAERLVHEEHLRRAHDGAAERHPLALSARELVRPLAQMLGDLQGLGDRRDPPADLARAARRARPAAWRCCRTP